LIGLLDSQRSFFSSVEPFASTGLTVDETEQADSVFHPSADAIGLSSC
jgi:hypothetical protein